MPLFICLWRAFPFSDRVLTRVGFLCLQWLDGLPEELADLFEVVGLSLHRLDCKRWFNLGARAAEQRHRLADLQLLKLQLLFSERKMIQRKCIQFNGHDHSGSAVLYLAFPVIVTQNNPITLVSH